MVRFHEEDVRRWARGVKAITLNEGDIFSMDLVERIKTPSNGTKAMERSIN